MFSSVSSSRRTFLKTGAMVTGGVALVGVRTSPLLAQLGGRPEPVPPIQDPRLKEPNREQKVSAILTALQKQPQR